MIEKITLKVPEKTRKQIYKLCEPYFSKRWTSIFTLYVSDGILDGFVVTDDEIESKEILDLFDKLRNKRDY